MRTLLIMRHAKSSWDDPRLDDHDRPLNKRGLRDAPRMGTLLQREGLVPDRIVSSSAVRALATAELLAGECRFDDEVTATPDLYHAREEDWREQVGLLSTGDTRVLCIGHNPGLEDFLAALTGQYVRMPTAAIAHLAFDDADWSEVATCTDGNLVEVWRPREVTDL